MLCKQLIKSWSSTQASVSLSSGEAEFYGVVKAGCVTLGYQSLLKDVGVELPVRVWTDSTATRGICVRQGLGKLRHIDTKCLWIQQKVRGKSLELFKVRGEKNPADLFTKHLVGQERIHTLLALFGCHYRGGRSSAAPMARAGATTSKGELLELQGHVLNPIEWCGHTFERAMGVEEALPEAYHSRTGLLQHQHGDLESRFPRALVGLPSPDKDPPSHDGLETRGMIIGQRVVRFRSDQKHPSATHGAARALPPRAPEHHDASRCSAGPSTPASCCIASFRVFI